jgi:hypothetical protein
MFSFIRGLFKGPGNTAPFTNLHGQAYEYELEHTPLLRLPFDSITI